MGERREVHFEAAAQEFTLLIICTRSIICRAIARLMVRFEEALKLAPARIRAVIEGLQVGVPGCAISAVYDRGGVGEVSRFQPGAATDGPYGARID